MYRYAALLPLSLLVLAGCGTGDGEPCDGIVCEAPAPHCEGQVAVSYIGAGVCAGGDCDFAAVEVRNDCAEDGQVCAGGVCAFAATCEADPDCVAPQAWCQGEVAVRYDGAGVCADGSCDWSAVENRTDCAATGDTCMGGQCQAAQACEAATDCASPPAPFCDDRRVMAYDQTGTCNASDACVYDASVSEDCGADGGVCSEGACVDCLTDAHCATPPAPSCDGADRLIPAPTGTCEAGNTCSYELTREACPEACAQGRCVNATSYAISQVREADPAGLPTSITVEGAVVTYVKPEGLSQHDGAGDGFFIQAEAEGPAVFVDAGAVARNVPIAAQPAVVPGDVIDLVVTDVSDVNGVTIVTGVLPMGGEAWQITGSAEVAPLVVDISEADDLRSDFERYESRLVRATGTLALYVREGQPGYSQWPWETAGMQDPPNGMLLRMESGQLNRGEHDLVEGCEVTVEGPVWGFESSAVYAQITAYRAEDVLSVSCPAPKVTGAYLVAEDRLAVTFDRTPAPETVAPEAFTVTGAGVVSAEAGPRHVLLTLDGPVGGGNVTVAGTLTGLYGETLDPQAAGAPFEALGSTQGPENAGMEDWWSPSSLMAWQRYYDGIGVDQEAADVHGGAWSARLTRERPDDDLAELWSATMPVVPGVSYDFGLWVRDQGPDAQAVLGVQWLDRARVAIGGLRDGGTSLDGPDWASLTSSHVAPQGAVWTRVRIQVRSEGAGTGGSLLVDDASIGVTTP